MSKFSVWPSINHLAALTISIHIWSYRKGIFWAIKGLIQYDDIYSFHVYWTSLLSGHMGKHKMMKALVLSAGKYNNKLSVQKNHPKMKMLGPQAQNVSRQI